MATQRTPLSVAPPPPTGVLSLKEWRKQTQRVAAVAGKRGRQAQEVEPIYQAIGAIIREMRERLGLSQRELAEACVVSVGQFVNMEKGKARTQAHQLYILAGKLRIPVQEFFEAEPEPEES